MAKKAREFDKSIFENMCRNHRSVEDIARFFGADSDTIRAWCKRTYKSPISAVMQQKCEEGNMYLLQNARNMATTNPTMMIFLLKNWVGYSDQPKPDNATNISLMQNLIDIHKNYNSQGDKE